MDEGAKAVLAMVIIGSISFVYITSILYDIVKIKLQVFRIHGATLTFNLLAGAAIWYVIRAYSDIDIIGNVVLLMALSMVFYTLGYTTASLSGRKKEEQSPFWLLMEQKVVELVKRIQAKFARLVRNIMMVPTVCKQYGEKGQKMLKGWIKVMGWRKRQGKIEKKEWNGQEWPMALSERAAPPGGGAKGEKVYADAS